VRTRGQGCYQTALQLAHDLDALIAGYRFDPKELRQFMRQLFRKEFAKEIEETELALEAEPAAAISAFSNRTPQGVTAQIEAQTPTQTMMPKIEMIEEPQTPPQQAPGPLPPTPGPTTQAGDDNRRSFWGSLFKRKK
jgi:hypothetical protein